MKARFQHALADCPFHLSWELVTPEAAKEMLEQNTHNRGLKRVTVDTFKRDMPTNRWSPNPATAFFYEGGKLGDGQHRLVAIVESERAQWMLIARQVPEQIGGVEARVGETVDRGNMRSLSDLLQLDHGIRKAEGPVIAAACVHIGRLCVDVPETACRKASMPQTVAVLELYREELKWMVQARPTTTGLRAVVLCATLAFAHRAMPNETESFYEVLITGAGLAADSPALLLRNAIMMDQLEIDGSTSGRKRSGMRVLAALQAFAAGERMTKLPRAEECGPALKWFKDQDKKRVAEVVTIFPTVMEPGVVSRGPRPPRKEKTSWRGGKGSKPARLVEPAPAPETPRVTGEVITSQTFKPTAAAERLLAKR